MCIAYPGRVVSVGPAGATVDTDGRQRQASTLLHPEVQVGDWVLVSVGTIVERLSAADAATIRDLLDAASVTAGGAQ